MDIDNLKKLEWLFQEENTIPFIEAFFRIVDKQNKIVQFKLTNEQKELVNGLDKFNIISKSRQLGISTITIALSLRQCIVQPNSHCLLASYNQKSVNDIFDKLKQQYNLLPKFLKPTEIANNKQELKFKNGSKITCTMAGNQDLGRGSTLSLVHLSEFALFKNQKQQLNSILQALAPDAKLIIESTSKGMNYYSELAINAQNNENDFKLFFFNWINGGSLFKKDYKNAVKRFKSRNDNKMLTKEELTEEERTLITLGATLEQIVWRRLKIETIGADLFKQEFPSTMLESFLTTGNSLFDAERINSIETALITNKTTPLNKIEDLPKELRKYFKRGLDIWEAPKQGMAYAIGVDCSEGVGQDYSVIEVINKDSMEQVAEFYNNKVKSYELAEIVNTIGRYYNNATVTVEKASAGHSVIERLRYTHKYRNMSKYKTYDKFNKIQWTYGFDTNGKTKSLIINDFIEMFEKGQLKINSRRLIGELKHFVILDNGSMGGNIGHDDSVMAFALAIVSLKTRAVSM